MLDIYFTNLREEIDRLLEMNGRTESDIEEVLISDDENDGLIHIDPKEFLEKADDTVYATESEVEALRAMIIRGRDFEIRTELGWVMEDSPVQYLSFRRIGNGGYDGCLLSPGVDRRIADRYHIEEDALHTDASLVERRMDRLIELAKKHEVIHMTVLDEGREAERGDTFMFAAGSRTHIQYKCRRSFSSCRFQDEAVEMLGVNAIVENLTCLKTPLEGRTIYGSGERKNEDEELVKLAADIPEVGYHDENGRLILPKDEYYKD